MASRPTGRVEGGRGVPGLSRARDRGKRGKVGRLLWKVGRLGQSAAWSAALCQGSLARVQRGGGSGWRVNAHRAVAGARRTRADQDVPQVEREAPHDAGGVSPDRRSAIWHRAIW